METLEAQYTLNSLNKITLIKGNNQNVLLLQVKNRNTEMLVRMPNMRIHFEIGPQRVILLIRLYYARLFVCVSVSYVRKVSLDSFECVKFSSNVENPKGYEMELLSFRSSDCYYIRFLSIYSFCFFIIIVNSFVWLDH